MIKKVCAFLQFFFISKSITIFVFPSQSSFQQSLQKSSYLSKKASVEKSRTPFFESNVVSIAGKKIKGIGKPVQKLELFKENITVKSLICTSLKVPLIIKNFTIKKSYWIHSTCVNNRKKILIPNNERQKKFIFLFNLISNF